MKRFICLFAGASVALLTSGCLLLGKPEKMLAALAKDPATAHLRISTIYGVIEYSRANPDPNSPSHAIAPDGTITITGSATTKLVEAPTPAVFMIQPQAPVADPGVIRVQPTKPTRR